MEQISITEPKDWEETEENQTKDQKSRCRISIDSKIRKLTKINKKTQIITDFWGFGQDNSIICDP